MQLDLIPGKLVTLIPFFETTDGDIIPDHWDLMKKLDDPNESFRNRFLDPNELQITETGKWNAILSYLGSGVPGYYCIWDNEAVTPIGFVGSRLFYGTVEKPLTVDLGIWVSDHHRGPGCIEAMLLYLDFLFTKTSVRRAQSLTPQGANTKFYERLGFINEGTMKDSRLVDGKFESAVMLSALRTNWFNKRSSTYKTKSQTISILEKALKGKERE